MQLVSLRTYFSNNHKRANEAKLELIIPIQIDVTHAQCDRITNSKVYTTITAILPLILTLLCMPKGYLCLFYLLDYIAYLLLSTFVWMHTPQHIHYIPNILPINQLKRGLLDQILSRNCSNTNSTNGAQGNPLAILINCY